MKHSRCTTENIVIITIVSILLCACLFFIIYESYAPPSYHSLNSTIVAQSAMASKIQAVSTVPSKVTTRSSEFTPIVVLPISTHPVARTHAPLHRILQNRKTIVSKKKKSKRTTLHWVKFLKRHSKNQRTTPRIDLHRVHVPKSTKKHYTFHWVKKRSIRLIPEIKVLHNVKEYPPHKK
jgi:hypothetical protein